MIKYLKFHLIYKDSVYEVRKVTNNHDEGNDPQLKDLEQCPALVLQPLDDRG